MGKIETLRTESHNNSTGNNNAGNRTGAPTRRETNLLILSAFPRPLSTAAQDGLGWKGAEAPPVPARPWRDTLHSPGCSKLALLPVLEEGCKGDASRDSGQLFPLLSNRFLPGKDTWPWTSSCPGGAVNKPTALRWFLPVQPAGT